MGVCAAPAYPSRARYPCLSVATRSPARNCEGALSYWSTRKGIWALNFRTYYEEFQCFGMSIFFFEISALGCVLSSPYGLRSPRDPRGLQGALRFDTVVLPRTQGNSNGTLLALIPRSNQKEIAQFTETTTVSNFPRLA
jgi:hypothetical protein